MLLLVAMITGTAANNASAPDMALFQEGWLDAFTDVAQEAVIDRSRRSTRTAARYEQLLTDALSELRRIIKPSGRVSMVFGNSSGQVWELVQRAIQAAELVVVPEALAVLDKGQRSVKGLASGFEHIATLDLVITMRRSDGDTPGLHKISEADIIQVTRELAKDSEATSPSHLYLELLRRGFRDGWRLGELDLRAVTSTLLDDGWQVDPKSGSLSRHKSG